MLVLNASARRPFTRTSKVDPSIVTVVAGKPRKWGPGELQAANKRTEINMRMSPGLHQMVNAILTMLAGLSKRLRQHVIGHMILPILKDR